MSLIHQEKNTIQYYHFQWTPTSDIPVTSSFDGQQAGTVHEECPEWNISAKVGVRRKTWQDGMMSPRPESQYYYLKKGLGWQDVPRQFNQQWCYSFKQSALHLFCTEFHRLIGKNCATFHPTQMWIIEHFSNGSNSNLNTQIQFNEKKLQ